MLFKRFNNIINPDYRYFSETSTEYQQGKQRFENAISRGNAQAFINILEEESDRICMSGNADLKREIHFLITEIKTAAWKNQTRNITLTNEEILFIGSLLRNRDLIKGCDAVASAVKEKLFERSEEEEKYNHDMKELTLVSE